MTGAGEPGGGVELMMEKHLVGTPGRQTFEQGRDGTIIPVGQSSLVPAVDGNDVTLTINSSLQWYAQNALAQRIKETKAASGTVVIEDVKTGNLLAVASYPSFDPNTDIGKKGTQLSNVAFSDVFEPGSTSKIMTMAAALEEGTVTPSTPVVIPNRLPRYDANFKDSHEHPTEYRTVAGTLAESSNIGTILVSETMKSKTLESYFRKFGLGAVSGTGYPGESRGLLDPSSQWSGTKRATVAFGQGISVTAVQAASVFQTIANDGVRVAPRLVESTTGADGTLTTTPASAKRRVVSHQTAADLSRMLEGVVSPDGTAEEAQIPGYRVAGKTGTADYYDFDAGQYSGRTASFIGYAPADDPQIVVAVIIQKPTYPFFGGYVSGPVFKDVTTYALQELKIPPTGKKAPKVTLEGHARGGAGRPHRPAQRAQAQRPVGSFDVAVPRPTRLRSTPLRDLAALLDAGDPGSEVAVTGVTLDSRAVLPGDLYAALPGARAHGADFAGQAAAAGALAVLTDRAGVDRMTAAGVALPAVVVEQPRAVLGAVSARVLGTERLALRLVGITGTNGKTTTAYLVHSALTAMGRRPGLIGTVETRIGDERVGSVRTTPEAPELHAVLAVMAERGLDSCVMEVSSHALAQHRVDGVVYDVALFTNLSQDHLDFHRDMDDYFAAKASLFTPERARQGVVCVDDAWGRRLAASAPHPGARRLGHGGRRGLAGRTSTAADPAAFRLTGPGGRRST